jgi:hypothetical protein
VWLERAVHWARQRPGDGAVRAIASPDAGGQELTWSGDRIGFDEGLALKLGPSMMTTSA